MKAARQTGFTLTEVMIAMAVIALLVMLAYPSYQRSIDQSRRLDAQNALTHFANQMQRFYTDNDTYKGAAVSGQDTGEPAIFPSQVPVQGDQPFYQLTILTASDSDFTLRATPVGQQSGDGFLELSSVGLQSWDKNNNGLINTGENRWH